MRERNLLNWFLGLNVSLAGAFVIFLFLSRQNDHPVLVTVFPGASSNQLAAAPNSPALTSPAPASAPDVKSEPPVSGNLAGGTNFDLSSSITATNEPTAVFSKRKIAWEQVETPEYKSYLDSLRAVGCPEDKVRYIAMTDINELFAKKRLKEAVDHDVKWWAAESQTLTAVNPLQEKGRQLEDDRKLLIEKLLGTEAAEAERSEGMLWSNVQLTGPVLGAMTPEKHNAVQEICAKSIDRHHGAMWARFNESQPLNQMEMARLREQTRADLRKILNDDEMEEFLLRYSHNSQQLRNELRGLDPTPEEFRKIFRAVDSIDHPIQLEYGGAEALSPQQRERTERQRDAAIKSVLPPERYQAYLLTKDPLYRQAQMYAAQYGAPAKAIMPLYQMSKTNELRRQKIIADTTLTPQRKSLTLNALNIEQQMSVQRIVVEAAQSQSK